MSQPLDDYHSKRNFAETPEPAGGETTGGEQRRFVVQEHHASRLHYDFRLEIGGVLKSWAVPKGPSLDSEVKRLAVPVEDHPVEYLTFEGTIEEGNYGAGTVYLWDTGTFDAREKDLLQGWEKGALHLTLYGERMRGGWRIFRTKGPGKPQWLLQKADDEHARPGHVAEFIGESQPAPTGERPPRVAVPAPIRREPQPPASTAITPEQFLAMPAPRGDLVLALGEERVWLTSLERVYWPEEGITKAQLLQYYLRVAPAMLPHLQERPAILRRHPRGIHEPSFYQHDLDAAPEWLSVMTLPKEGGRPVNHGIYTSVASLLYLANLGAIEQHAWQCRVDDLEHPDRLVLDLDPYEAPWEHLVQVALAARHSLTALGLTPYVKTSGASGLHVYAPLPPGTTFDRAHDLAEAVARFVAEQLPQMATVHRRIGSRRPGQIYVDYEQNSYGKSVAAPYSVRARPGATVSYPLTWDDLEAGARIQDFTLLTVPQHLTHGDAWASLVTPASI